MCGEGQYRIMDPPQLYYLELLGVSAVNFMPFFSASERACFAAPEKRPRKPTVMPLVFKYSRFVAICYPSNC